MYLVPYAGEKMMRLTLWIRGLIGKKIIWLPPVLLAIVPTLDVYTHNVNLLSLERMVIPLIYSVGFMVLSSFVAYAIFKNEEKASVFTSIWMILFFSYGYIFLNLGKSKLLENLPISLNKLLFGLYGVILFITIRFLFKHKQSLRRFIVFLALTGITITLLNLAKIVPSEINRWVDGRKLNQYVSNNLGPIPFINNGSNLKPDIYYIIFDRYGRQDVLQKYFDFQNESHLDYLRSKGFWVGDESYANYPYTFLSFSSSLNMSYLEFLTDIFGNNQGNQVTVYRQLLQDNQLVRFLKSQGYRYILIGDSWDPLRQKESVDENYNLFADFDEFHLYIYERTLLNVLRGIIEGKQLYTGTERFNKISLNLDYRLHKIKTLENNLQPTFVFGHFLLPHPPYVFSSECDPYTLSKSSQQVPENGYLNQIQCANVVMKSLVSQIQSRSNRPAVIIFQSDEGPYLPLKYFNGDGESVPENYDSYFIHGAILNAVYLPQKEDATKPVDYTSIGFKPNLSPVNTIRTVLNYYFGTNLQILPNKTYFSPDDKHIYDFKEVTNYYDSKK